MPSLQPQATGWRGFNQPPFLAERILRLACLGFPPPYFLNTRSKLVREEKPEACAMAVALRSRLQHPQRMENPHRPM